MSIGGTAEDGGDPAGEPDDSTIGAKRVLVPGSNPGPGRGGMGEDGR